MTGNIVSGGAGVVREAAQEMVKKSAVMGAWKKTMLVGKVQEELKASGSISKFTQLALDDEAHVTDPPT